MWSTNGFVYFTMAVIMVAADGENNDDFQMMGQRQYTQGQNSLRRVLQPIHRIPRPQPKPTLIQVVEPPTTTTSIPAIVDELFLQPNSEPRRSPTYHRPVLSVRPNQDPSLRPLAAPRPLPRPINVRPITASQPESPVVVPSANNNPGRPSWTLQPRPSPSVTVIPDYIEEPITPTSSAAPAITISPSYTPFNRPLLPSRPMHRPNPINLGTLTTLQPPMKPEPSTTALPPPVVIEADPPVITEYPLVTSSSPPLPEETTPEIVTITELAPKFVGMVETTPAPERPVTGTNWRPSRPGPQEPIVLPVDPEKPISSSSRPLITNWRPRSQPGEPMVQPPVTTIFIPKRPTPEPPIVVPEPATPEQEVQFTTSSPSIRPIPEEPIVQPPVTPIIIAYPAITIFPSYTLFNRPLLPSRPMHRPNPINLGTLTTLQPPKKPEPSTTTLPPPVVIEADPPVITEYPLVTSSSPPLPEETTPEIVTITELAPTFVGMVETTPAPERPVTGTNSRPSPVAVTAHRPPPIYVGQYKPPTSSVSTPTEIRPRPPLSNWRPSRPGPQEPIVLPVDSEKPISSSSRPLITNWRPRPPSGEPMVQPPVTTIFIPKQPTPEPPIVVPEPATPEQEVQFTTSSPSIRPIPEEPIVQPPVTPIIIPEWSTSPVPPLSTSARPSINDWRPRPIASPPVVEPISPSRRPEIQVPATYKPPTYKPAKTISGWLSSLVPPQPVSHDHVIDFKCNNDGYFNSSQECDAYIECKRGIAIEYLCPDGLHFNPDVNYPDYPCAYPSEVQCVGRAITQKPIPTSKCPHQYGYFSIENGECSKYVMCQEGMATIMNCPPGLVFNPELSACDWPEKVPSCNPDVFQGFKCPAPPLDEDGHPTDIIINYKYGDSCNNYVACQRGRPRLLSCDMGFSFDALAGYCLESDYVKNCE